MVSSQGSPDADSVPEVLRRCGADTCAVTLKYLLVGLLRPVARAALKECKKMIESLISKIGRGIVEGLGIDSLVYDAIPVIEFAFRGLSEQSTAIMAAYQRGLVAIATLD